MNIATADYPARRELRYEIAGQSISTELIERCGDQESRRGGEMINISSGGATVSLGSPLAIDATVSLTIEACEMELDQVVPATVRWCRPARGGAWWSGLMFAEKLPERVLTQLAMGGCLERRQDDRTLGLAAATGIAAQARWELNPSTYDVTVSNASPGGFCMLAPAPMQHEGRLLVQFERTSRSPIVIRAKARWEQAIENGYLIGCEFADAKNYLLFLDLVDTPTPERSQPVKNRLLRWLVGQR